MSTLNTTTFALNTTTTTPPADSIYYEINRRLFEALYRVERGYPPMVQRIVEEVITMAINFNKAHQDNRTIILFDDDLMAMLSKVLIFLRMDKPRDVVNALIDDIATKVHAIMRAQVIKSLHDDYLKRQLTYCKEVHDEVMSWKLLEAAKSADESSVKDPGESLVKDLGESSVKDPGESSVKDSGESSVKDSGESPVKNSSKSSGKSPVKNSGKSPVKNSSGKKTWADQVEEEDAQAAEAAQAPVQDAAQASIQDAAQAAEAAQAPVQDAAQASVQDAAQATQAATQEGGWEDVKARRTKASAPKATVYFSRILKSKLDEKSPLSPQIEKYTSKFMKTCRIVKFIGCQQGQKVAFCLSNEELDEAEKLFRGGEWSGMRRFMCGSESFIFSVYNENNRPY